MHYLNNPVNSGVFCRRITIYIANTIILAVLITNISLGGGLTTSAIICDVFVIIVTIPSLIGAILLNKPTLLAGGITQLIIAFYSAFSIVYLILLFSWFPSVYDIMKNQLIVFEVTMVVPIALLIISGCIVLH